MKLDSIIQGTISFIGSDRNNFFAKLESVGEISEAFLSITLRKNITTRMKKCFYCHWYERDSLVGVEKLEIQIKQKCVSFHSGFGTTSWFKQIQKVHEKISESI